MEKQQLIHNKWSDLGIILLVSQYDLDGWIDVNELEKEHLTNELEYKEYSKPDSDFKTMLCRPKSLKGIEDNNGWIKLDAKLDLPKENGQYLTRRANGIIITEWFYNNNLSWYLWKDCYSITHYQPIIKPREPLY